jgi:hypothetical protein
MPSYYVALAILPICESGLPAVTCETKRYHFDTYQAYGHAMALMQDNPEFQTIKLAEDREQIKAGWYYLFEREESGIIQTYSVTPHFKERIDPLNICDYFRRPVYRRCSNV